MKQPPFVDLNSKSDMDFQACWKPRLPWNSPIFYHETYGNVVWFFDGKLQPFRFPPKCSKKLNVNRMGAVGPGLICNFRSSLVTGRMVEFTHWNLTRKFPVMTSIARGKTEANQGWTLWKKDMHIYIYIYRLNKPVPVARSPTKDRLGGGFKACLIFTPNFGEDEPILTSICFKWVGSTTN